MSSCATSGLHITLLAVRNATNWLQFFGGRPAAAHLQPFRPPPSLVLTPAVANPAGRVMPARIPVSPVHHTALPVPLILAGNLAGRAGPQPFDPWRQVEVVCDEHRLPGWQTNDEPLMPGTLRIVFQHLGNDPMTPHFDAARVTPVGRAEGIFVPVLGRMR